MLIFCDFVCYLCCSDNLHLRFFFSYRFIFFSLFHATCGRNDWKGVVFIALNVTSSWILIIIIAYKPRLVMVLCWKKVFCKIVFCHSWRPDRVLSSFFLIEMQIIFFLCIWTSHIFTAADFLIVFFQPSFLHYIFSLRWYVALLQTKHPKGYFRKTKIKTNLYATGSLGKTVVKDCGKTKIIAIKQ